MQRTTSLSRRAGIVLVGAALALTACGGGDDDVAADEPAGADSAPTDSGVTDDAAATTDGPADEEPPPAGTDATTPEEPADDGTFEAGPYQYRVINLLDQPVDVYGRTQGFVEAYELFLGVAPMEVSEFGAPPVDGNLIITAVGGDPECVATCPDTIANLSSFESDGPIHTVILHDADGAPSALDLWEDHDGTSPNGNAMAAANPDAGLFEVTSIDVTDNDFGMLLGFDGTAGCIAGDQENILIGGNQIPAWTYGGDSVDVLLYDNQDRECTDPVGGPFTITGGPGTRTHLILTGTPGALEAIVVPFATSAEPAAGDTGGSESAGGAVDRDEAVTALADILVAEIGLEQADGLCLAPYVIDAVGLDAMFPNGEMLELEDADPELQDQALLGVLEGIEGCGIDPAMIGL